MKSSFSHSGCTRILSLFWYSHVNSLASLTTYLHDSTQPEMIHFICVICSELAILYITMLHFSPICKQRRSCYNAFVFSFYILVKHQNLARHSTVLCVLSSICNFGVRDRRHWNCFNQTFETSYLLYKNRELFSLNCFIWRFIWEIFDVWGVLRHRYFQNKTHWYLLAKLLFAWNIF